MPAFRYTLLAIQFSSFFFCINLHRQSTLLLAARPATASVSALMDFPRFTCLQNVVINLYSW